MSYLALNSEVQEIFTAEGLCASGVLNFDEFLHPDTTLSQNLAEAFNAWQQWIDQGYNAGMQYMAQHKAIRAQPQLLMDNVRSAIVVLAPYAHGKKVRRRGANLDLSQTSAHSQLSPQSVLNYVARYAKGKDYHKVLKSSLAQVVNQLEGHFQQKIAYRALVDSAPLFERALAKTAALGFVGKNTMLIRPGMGSYFFIATLLLDLPATKLATVVKSNAIENLNCGDCDLCLTSCPTQAFPKPYVLDANQCLSYLSIEHRDKVPNKFIHLFKETMYGCDICQEVCPYNLKTLDMLNIPKLHEPHFPLSMVTPLQVAKMDELEYSQWFGGTALTRAKYGGLVRNALYHLYATAAPELHEVLQLRQKDVVPLIRETVQQILDVLK